MSETLDYAALMKRALQEIQSLKSELAEARAARHEPIAIVGMACRFPGGANTPDDYWDLLKRGTDAITEVPRSRWDIDSVYDADPDAPGKMYTRHGGFLDGIEQFDANFFGVSPLDATNMDPQQRLLLEVAWEALENAGQVPGSIAKTGVWVGTFMDDYLQLNFQSVDRRAIDAYNTLGLLRGLAAGRLAYALDLHGPAMQLDTACSSSLLAAHLACQSLRNRECDLALAGGVNLILVPEVTIGLCRMKAMAADGRCKSFDATADGYVRGEGCGIVVLRRLSDALADGDAIHAVIRGSAVNHDGRSNGLTAPNGSAQKMLIRDALDDAGVGPLALQYVEAHSTGTSLGDPIEAIALGEVLCQGRSNDQRLLVGSVKSNFGHLESAAGVAALMKVALSLRHGAIPPSLHFREPNPHIPWERLPIAVPASLSEWPAGAPRLAGVSSFGMSGTNVHMIVEQAPPSVPRASDGPHVLTLSAQTPEALGELARKYATFLETADDAALRDICCTSNQARRHFDHRLAVAGDSTKGLAAKLKTARAPRRSGRRRPRIAFLFPGYASGIEALAEAMNALYRDGPAFREAIDACAALLPSFRDGAQTALFAFQYALARLWMSWGITPDAVLGHGDGEYAAACVAGVFRLEDALNLVAERERMMGALPGKGAMAAIFCGEERVAGAVRSQDAPVSIAALNGLHVVVSGRESDIDVLAARFRSEGVEVQPLEVVHALHSSLMDPMLDELEELVSRFALQPPDRTFVSTLTGDVASRELTQPSYWRRQIREPVRIADGMRKLRDLDHRIVIEIGPRPVLSTLAQQIVEDLTVLPGVRPDGGDWQRLLESLALLYENGFDPDWAAVEGKAAKIALPAYPFQRQPFWVRHKTRPRSRFHFEWQPGQDVSLRGHRLHGRVLVPAASYLSMVQGSVQGSVPGAAALRDVRFTKPLSLSENDDRTLHLVVTPGGGFQFVTQQSDELSTGEWVEHCSGTIEPAPADAESESFEALSARFGEEKPAEGVEAGFSIGEGYQWTRSVRSGQQEVLCRMQSADHFPAGLIDSCLRTLSLCAERRPEDGTIHVPFRIEAVRFLGSPSANAELWCHARATEISDDRIAGNVRVLDSAGMLLMDVAGLETRRVPESLLAGESALEDSLLEIEWQPASWPQLQPGELPPEPGGQVFVCEGDDAGARLLEVLRTIGDDETLRIVTRNAQPVLPRDRVDPTHAWVWGLGRVLSIERPRLRCLRVDLDATASLGALPGGEDQVAIRGGVAYVPRLVRKRLDVPGAGPLFRADATYLITGAFGALGSRIARWMVEEGARHLVLAGRHASPVPDLEANVRVVSADLADPDAVARLFATNGPVHGIMHAAGVLDDGLLRDLTWDRFERVFAPKVRGTWNLHTQSLALDLEFFVCFSSVASLIGSAGQANYAAANSFMDALMHHRRALSLAGLSINWSAWGESGMAAAMDDRLRSMGIEPIDPPSGLELLGRIMRSGATQIGVLPADFSKLLPSMFAAPPRMFANLVTARESAAPSAISRLRHTSHDERKKELENHIRERIVSVMGRDPFPSSDNDVSFFELGMDSLMSLDLRNRLQADLDRPLPSTVAFEYPSIPHLADYLLASVLPSGVV